MPPCCTTRAPCLLPEIAAGAAERERTRELPYALVRRIAEAGLLTWRIPKAFGGPGASVREVIRFVVELAAVDSNTAQALRPTSAPSTACCTAAPKAEQRLWFGRLLAGDIFGNGGLERGGAPRRQHRHAAPRGRSLPHRRPQVLQHRRPVRRLDQLAGARRERAGGGLHGVAAPPGLELLDDFDSIGQRLTASGSTHFNHVLVCPEELRVNSFPRDRRSPIAPLFQLFPRGGRGRHRAQCLNDAVAFAATRARPIRHSTASRSVDDPYVQETVGQIAAQAYAARPPCCAPPMHWTRPGPTSSASAA
jgi:alkylation response protein AidB-like acyl-CoA dehydrogenase